MEDELKKFRVAIDEDSGLSAKRNLLVTASLILLALNMSGAKVVEANTFILKISFENHHGILWLLNVSTVFLMIRYYGYAQNYHAKLYELWSTRMMNDRELLRVGSDNNYIEGLLEKKLPGFLADEPEQLSSKYEAFFPFKRNLRYQSNGPHLEDGEQVVFENIIELNKYDKRWRRSDMMVLFFYEIKYQTEALIRYREGLDLLAPYIIGGSAIFSTLYRFYRI